MNLDINYFIFIRINTYFILLNKKLFNLNFNGDWGLGIGD